MRSEPTTIMFDRGSAVTADPRCDRLHVWQGRFSSDALTAEQPQNVLDLRGLHVLPGLIDMHLHGGKGISFEESTDDEAMRSLAVWLASHGVTGYLRSISAPDQRALMALVRQHTRQMQRHQGGAMPLGLHLEGPWLNPERAGAFNPAWLRQPEETDLVALLEAGEGAISVVTLAPELPHAYEIAARLRARNVVCALGHSNASYEQAARALAGDFTHVTHVFNAQSPFHHRAPGVVGAVLTSDDVTAEVIADGQHVHAGALRLLLRSLGAQRLALVSDGSMAAGMPDGRYHLAGHPVLVREGVARLTDGTLAGSTATLDVCLTMMVEFAGASLDQAACMASSVPARVLGISGWQGALHSGKQADLTAMDEHGKVVLTMVKGQIVFSQL